MDRKSQKLNIIVCGYMGRMGQEICKIIKESPDLNLTKGIDINEKMGSFIEGADVIIDFSTPLASIEFAELAARKNIPIVIGTTGFDHEQEVKIINASLDTAVLRSPNMSLGVNLMWNLAKIATDKMKWKKSIIETHHIHKKDRPSGTAFKIAEKIKHKENIVCFENKFPEKEQPENEIWICSIRRDEVIGNHDLILRSPEEEITISHKALSRKVLAKGAVEVAKWLAKKPAGLYDMQNLI